MFGGQRPHLLETKTYVDGGNVQVNIRGVPRNQKIKAIQLILDAVITQGGSAVAITGRNLKRLFKSIRLGDRVLFSGMAFDVMNWHMRGLELDLPADVPATNSQVFNREICATIPYFDQNCIGTDDCDPLPEFYESTPLTIDFDTSTALFTSLASVTGTLRVELLLERADFGVVPSIVEYGFFDPNGQHIELAGERVITHLNIFKESGTGLTSAEITGLNITADGELQTNLPMRVQDMARFFNNFTADGTSNITSSATAQIAGERLTDDPSVAAAGSTTVTVEWLPVITQAQVYKIPKVLQVEKSLILDLTGSLTTGFRVGYRAIIPRTDAQRERMRVAAGIPDGWTPVTKTASKTGSRSIRLARILPLRYQEAPAAIPAPAAGK